MKWLKWLYPLYIWIVKIHFHLINMPENVSKIR